MLAALLRRVALAPASRGVLGALQPLAGQWRGMKGKVLRKAMWDGWPRFSPDGWPYARHLKRSRGKEYMSKQAWRRMMGRDKGARARVRRARLRVLPHFFFAASRASQVGWRASCRARSLLISRPP